MRQSHKARATGFSRRLSQTWYASEAGLPGQSLLHPDHWAVKLSTTSMLHAQLTALHKSEISQGTGSPIRRRSRQSTPIRVVLWAIMSIGLISRFAIQARSQMTAPFVTATPNGLRPPSMGLLAVSADSFLSSLGVTTHADQGYDPSSYIEPLRYTGIRQVREGTQNIPGLLKIHQHTGVHFTLNGGGNLDRLISAARTLADAHALLALEGPNEPNNFAISYRGSKGGGPGNTWVPVAQFQKDLYAAVKHDPLLWQYPVFGPSEVGAETDNVGLQFLVIPPRAGASFGEGTQFADYANVHNYVSGNGNRYEDNQAWNAADPTLNARWDGLYGNHGVTWYRHYQGYDNDELPTIPRVTTETGWDTASDAGGQHTQGTVLTNTYLAQFKRGWGYTFIYELRDGEGGAGEQGLYSGSRPKLSATYIHNLTSILSDGAFVGKSDSLDYTVSCQCTTVHDLLLQKSTGQFELVVWDERIRGSDDVTIGFGITPAIVKIYDITIGTTPVEILKAAGSVHLEPSDHAMILELGGD
jgi:hypothetical protein